MRRISVLMIFHISNGWEDACRLFKKKGAQTGSKCNEFSQLTYVYYVQLYNAPIQQDKSWWSLEV